MQSIETRRVSCRTCSITNRVIEQVQYLNIPNMFIFGYLPAHYLARMTPLRFVDMPKIRTLASFGERVVSANSSYIYATSGVRIWVYEKIIELLEVGLRYYNELLNGFSETAAAETRYSEDITACWGSAGLPQTIAGTFFSPGSGPTRTQRPAALSFVLPGTEPELWGWYFSIGETASSARAGAGFSIFIDPLKSPETIYSRKGKTPGEKRLQLDRVIFFYFFPTWKHRRGSSGRRGSASPLQTSGC
jgi:hypothetical protein